jgi:predicted HAD superfamily Cof-like phosphohydrolase
MNNPLQDIKTMMDHYGFKPEQLTPERLKFRLSLLQEEFGELQIAMSNQDAPETVDALIDIVVIALGTLHLAEVDVDKAWRTVHTANMQKLKGKKPGRPSDGWDLYKPLNWVAPDHENNTGKFATYLKENTQ